jgi:hypothetical protein
MKKILIDISSNNQGNALSYGFIGTYEPKDLAIFFLFYCYHYPIKPPTLFLPCSSLGDNGDGAFLVVTTSFSSSWYSCSSSFRSSCSSSSEPSSSYSSSSSSEESAPSNFPIWSLILFLNSLRSSLSYSGSILRILLNKYRV